MSNTPRTDELIASIKKELSAEACDSDHPYYVLDLAARELRTLERENTDLLEKLRAATSMPCARSATAAVQQLNGALMNSMGQDFEISATFVRDALIPALKAARVEVGAMAMLRELREYLSDGRHSQWRYVESGEQGEDMGEWVKKLGSFLDSRDMKGEQP